jgi:hypothetical protein
MSVLLNSGGGLIARRPCSVIDVVRRFWWHHRRMCQQLRREDAAPGRAVSGSEGAGATVGPAHSFSGPKVRAARRSMHGEGVIWDDRASTRVVPGGPLNMPTSRLT